MKYVVIQKIKFSCSLLPKLYYDSHRKYNTVGPPVSLKADLYRGIVIFHLELDFGYIWDEVWW